MRNGYEKDSNFVDATVPNMRINSLPSNFLVWYEVLLDRNSNNKVEVVRCIVDSSGEKKWIGLRSVSGMGNKDRKEICQVKLLYKVKI